MQIPNGVNQKPGNLKCCAPFNERIFIVQYPEGIYIHRKGKRA